MATTPAEGFERLRAMGAAGELADLANRHGVSLLVVFGSAIGPHAAQAHDLDVAVLFDDPSSDILRVTNALIDATDCEQIDVLDLGRAGPVAREQALVGTVPLYERDTGTLAALRDAAIVRRMDTDWLRRLDLQLMAES